MVDAILSYHADPLTCGVTKFSQQLARRLEVPWHQLANGILRQNALVSVKLAELAPDVILGALPLSYFLHDWRESFAPAVKRARLVVAASAALADQIRPHRPDVIPAWCPALVEIAPREPITVLSFGMAHKIRTDLYARLKELLDASGDPYVVYVSAALHEGTTFSDAAQSFETLRKLFGPHFVFLGTLSDEAMVDRLRTCSYVAAFFEHGLRENNTSVLAALEAGARVLTNHDAHTPDLLAALTHDLPSLVTLPHVAQREAVRARYGWDTLVELIRGA